MILNRDSSRLATGLLALIFVLGATLRIINVSNISNRSPDERVYLAQANAIRLDGIAGLRRIVKTYIDNEALWIYPPPTRVGYLYSNVAVMKLAGSGNMTPATYLSCSASIATLGVALALGLKLFGTWSTLISLFFLALFPAELVIARRNWPDAMAGLAGFAMLYWIAAIGTNPHRRVPPLALVFTGTLAVLIKETLVLLYLPCLAVAIYSYAVNANFRRKAIFVFLGAVCGGVADAALLAGFIGGWASPIRILLTQVHHGAINPYALETMSGPGYLLLEALYALSPVTIGFALIGILLLPVLLRSRNVVTVAFLSLLYLSIFMVVPHWRNVRYVSPVYAPLCLFAGAALWHLIVLARTRLRPVFFRTVVSLSLIAVFSSVLADFGRFESVFVRGGVNDLAVAVILRYVPVRR